MALNLVEVELDGDLLAGLVALPRPRVLLLWQKSAFQAAGSSLAPLRARRPCASISPTAPGDVASSLHQRPLLPSQAAADGSWVHTTRPG
jgi:hypothetical protein